MIVPAWDRKALDTLEGNIQALVTGGRCEEEGCRRKAEWYVNRGKESFHWCPMHTIACMDEKDYWKQNHSPLAHIKQ
jgi:hypothetical protein